MTSLRYSRLNGSLTGTKILWRLSKVHGKLMDMWISQQIAARAVRLIHLGLVLVKLNELKAQSEQWSAILHIYSSDSPMQSEQRRNHTRSHSKYGIVNNKVIRKILIRRQEFPGACNLNRSRGNNRLKVFSIVISVMQNGRIWKCLPSAKFFFCISVSSRQHQQDL